MPQNPKLSPQWQDMLGANWQEVQKTYLHTIGNLTLTGYNSELSDHSFDIKKSIEGGFNDSPLHLNRFMQKVDVWNEATITQRAKELATLAAKVWYAPNLSQDILDKYIPSKEKKEITYTLKTYVHLKDEILELYQLLRKRILNIDASVKEEYKKQYIAFKAQANFVEILPQKSELFLYINIDPNKVDDPKKICKKVSNIGRWGNGDIRVVISKVNQIDDVMALIQQAFDEQMGEGD